MEIIGIIIAGIALIAGFIEYGSLKEKVQSLETLETNLKKPQGLAFLFEQAPPDVLDLINKKIADRIDQSDTFSERIVRIAREQLGDSFYSAVPKGTIVASLLPPNEFLADSIIKDFWHPADGTDRTPDLRGLFLRGLNHFQSEGTNPRENKWSDPEPGRFAGHLQWDSLRHHDHHVPGVENNNQRVPKWAPLTGEGDYWDTPGKGGTQTNRPQGKDVLVTSETRPKNIAVFYYIKVK